MSIITSDGRSIIVCRRLSPLGAHHTLPMPQGTLRGFDQACNLILDECFERVYSSKVRACHAINFIYHSYVQQSGVETIMLGLYVVRGDNVYVGSKLDVLAYLRYLQPPQVVVAVDVHTLSTTLHINPQGGCWGGG